MVNTVDCGSIMQGFDSLISPHENTNYDSISYRNFSFIQKITSIIEATLIKANECHFFITKTNKVKSSKMSDM